MDLSDPTRAVTPTLDGPVLAVLAQAGRPLTVGEVAAQAARGSEIGIRRALARLVDQGIVRATQMGRNQVHELNREHLAASVADTFASLRLELWRRLRDELSRWDPRPVYGCVFGSAARGDGTEGSDIDLLLVHPPFRSDRRPRRTSSSWLDVLSALTDSVATSRFPIADEEPWHGQVDRLRDLVQRWTGNPLQVVDMSLYDYHDPRGPHAALLAEVRRDGVEVASMPPVTKVVVSRPVRA